MKDNYNTLMLEIQNIYSNKNRDIFTQCLKGQQNTLNIYKRYLNGEVPDYKYVSDDFNNDDLSRTVYEVECTYRFLREVFNVKIAMPDVAKVSCSVYRGYYEGNKEMLHKSILEYNQILELIKVKYTYFKTTTELENTLSNVIINLFPSINNKEVLKKISQHTLISQPLVMHEVRSSKLDNFYIVMFNKIKNILKIN